MAKRKEHTMKSFGVAPRVGYNSEGFYAREMYSNHRDNGKPSGIEHAVPSGVIDKIYCQDSRHMDQLPDCSVHLMVTSPPYNVGKEYDDNLSLKEYRTLLRSVFQETHRVLIPGGRVCINVANLGRKPYIPLHRYIIEEMENLGFLMRGEIIWDKSASAGVSTAWGSWQSAANPTLRDVHEYILIFSKDTFQRTRGTKKNTITKEQFLEYTKSIWTFPAESAKKVDHPAPFPVELPYRLIQLYTFEGDIVLDPFAGSGSTCVAAVKAARHFVGYDISKEYVQKAMKRITSMLDGSRIPSCK
ncbi:MAG: site-specific DNA-methyltransferase [Ignavibacteria bacterium]|nr:site-specific DNA-methyltransferase [Ignavibacteria bacterium]MBI3765887.1 site-specific DNA-methyltransferase [Ignavibacteriales bacterium]